MQYFRTLGVKARSHSRKCSPAREARKQDIARFEVAARRPLGMGSSTFGSILAASTRRAARNFQKQLIRCISGTKKLKFAMFTCRMSSPDFDL